MKSLKIVPVFMVFCVILSCNEDDNGLANKLVIDGSEVAFNIYHDDYGNDCLNGDRRLDENTLCESHHAFVIALTDGTIDQNGNKENYSFWIYIVLFSTDLENLESGSYEIIPSDFYAFDHQNELVARIYGGVDGYNIERFNGVISVNGSIEHINLKIDMTVEHYYDLATRTNETVPTFAIEGKYSGKLLDGNLAL